MTICAPIAWHVTLRLDRDHDRVIATTMAEIRDAARLFLHLGRRVDLLAFGIADTHMHALLACDRAAAGRFVHGLEVGLRRRLKLPVPFAAARFTPVEQQRHLRNTVGYVFAQDDHHDLGRDPFREGTNLCDLLGARTAGRWTVDRFKELLPRVGQHDLLRHLPGAASLASPAPPEALDLLPEVVAALGLAPDLRGKRPEVVAARAAAVHFGLQHLAPGQLASLLDIGTTSLHRLRGTPVDSALVTAVELQLRMRHGARTGGSG